MSIQVAYFQHHVSCADFVVGRATVGGLGRGANTRSGYSIRSETDCAADGGRRRATLVGGNGWRRVCLPGAELLTIDFQLSYFVWLLFKAYCYIVAGACFAIALRFAGSANQEAFNTLVRVFLSSKISYMISAEILSHVVAGTAQRSRHS